MAPARDKSEGTGDPPAYLRIRVMGAPSSKERAVVLFGLEPAGDVGTDVLVRLPTRGAVGIGRLPIDGARRASWTGPWIGVFDANLSRSNSRIVYAEDGYLLEDLKSAGGTFVNDEKLSSGRPHLLQHGDVIHLGPPATGGTAVFLREQGLGAPRTLPSSPEGSF